LIWGSAALLLKVNAAQSAAYTSDLYDFHMGLRSTVDGHFFRSYVYGNVLGDHAYLFLLGLLPAYYLNDSGAFWVLVLAAPVSMVAGLLAIRATVGMRRHPYPNLSMVALLAVPGLFWVIHEPVYGFHPDTLAAPLLLVAAIGLDGTGSRERDVGDTMAWIAFVAFVSLKEEMALLGVFFALPFLLTRPTRSVGTKLATVSTITAVLGYLVVRSHRTPWTRGNGALVEAALVRLGGPAWGWDGWVWSILVPASGAVLLGLGLFRWRRHLSKSDLAIGSVLTAKILALILVFPSLPGPSWHLAIPIAAVAYGTYRSTQFLSRVEPRLRRPVAFAGLLALLSLVLAIDVRWYSSYRDLLDRRAVAGQAAESAHQELAPIVGAGVVSVPPYDLHAWRDHAAVALPRGLHESPPGIADAFITERRELPADLHVMMACFTPRPSHGPRLVFLKTGDCGQDDERAAFDAISGLP
jgi:hypothetical protein